MTDEIDVEAEAWEIHAEECPCSKPCNDCEPTVDKIAGHLRSLIKHTEDRVRAEERARAALIVTSNPTPCWECGHYFCEKQRKLAAALRGEKP